MRRQPARRSPVEHRRGRPGAGLEELGERDAAVAQRDEMLDLKAWPVLDICAVSGRIWIGDDRRDTGGADRRHLVGRESGQRHHHVGLQRLPQRTSSSWSDAAPNRLLLAYGTFHAQLPPLSPELRARIRGRHGLMQFRPSTVERMNRNYSGRIEAMADPFAFPGGHDLRGMPPALVLDADRTRSAPPANASRPSWQMAAPTSPTTSCPNPDHGFLGIRAGTPAFDDGIRRATWWLAHATPKESFDGDSPTLRHHRATEGHDR